ncbi:MAG TPA: hypothetical protein VGM26_12425 [Rhizomicrobium sp.]|jgi:hypothetical protein
MTNFRIQNENQNNVSDFIAEIFTAATIAMVGVLGMLTLAATI